VTCRPFPGSRMLFPTISGYIVTSMTSRVFGFSKPREEWHQVRYLDSVRSNRQLMLAWAMVLWIAVLDFSIPRTNFSVLYVVPMILLAGSVERQRVWKIAGGLALLTYVLFFLKNFLNPSEQGSSYFDYRLFNRSMVVLMLLSMTKV